MCTGLHSVDNTRHDKKNPVQGFCFDKYQGTVDSRRIKILVHNICLMFVLNGSLTAHSSCTIKDFWNLTKDSSSHLYASFGTFWVQIGQLFEVQWDFKLWEEFEIDVIFLWKQRFDRFQTFFKDSLWLQKLTNLDAKGAKRSVKMWATNF